jgi:hypothetical protein
MNDLYASVNADATDSGPEEERLLYVLEQLEHMVILIQRRPTDANSQAQGQKAAPRQTATSALLGSVDNRPAPAQISKTLVLNNISGCAERILRNEDVRISRAVLKAYVDLQCRLQKPTSFPDIFHAYANRRLAREVDDGLPLVLIDYFKRMPSFAVPPTIAAKALDAAIATHDLACAIDIIETAHSTEAYQNSKILREAALPIFGASILPIALWTIATRIGQLSPSFSAEVGTNVAFAGIMTYIAAVGTLGYISITTGNDQMQRVTWAQGIPLYERWMREEERAAIDKVAVAWGFKDPLKRGEELGDEWAYLKEWVGMRAMILDRISLMEGME